MNCDKLNFYLDKLAEDIYYQPEDVGHTDWARLVIEQMCPDVSTVLDVGCGTGFCQPLFESKQVAYSGCTLGADDYNEAVIKNRTVIRCDMSDIPVMDNMVDMIFARHVLEHSPMPIITLMEWKRITKQYILLVMPAPEYWTYRGKNHYSVMNKDQLWNLFEQVGLKLVKEQDFMTSHKLFMKHYMPEIKERDTLTYPGRPIPVEYWYLLEIE